MAAAAKRVGLDALRLHIPKVALGPKPNGRRPVTINPRRRRPAVHKPKPLANDPGRQGRWGQRLQSIHA